MDNECSNIIFQSVCVLQQIKKSKLIMGMLAVFTFLLLTCTYIQSFDLESAREISSLARGIEKECEECLMKAKFFYRGFFPDTNSTIACVPSHEHLVDNSFIKKKACTIEECKNIGNLFVARECFPPHPLSY